MIPQDCQNGARMKLVTDIRDAIRIIVPSVAHGPAVDSGWPRSIVSAGFERFGPHPGGERIMISLIRSATALLLISTTASAQPSSLAQPSARPAAIVQTSPGPATPVAEPALCVIDLGDGRPIYVAPVPHDGTEAAEAVHPDGNEPPCASELVVQAKTLDAQEEPAETLPDMVLPTPDGNLADTPVS